MSDVDKLIEMFLEDIKNHKDFLILKTKIKMAHLEILIDKTHETISATQLR